MLQIEIYPNRNTIFLTIASWLFTNYRQAQHSALKIMQLTKYYVKRVLPFYNYLLSQSSTKFLKKTSWVKTTSIMQFFFPKIAYFFRFENIMLTAESEFFAAIHLENWDFSRQMFFSDHQWKIRLLGDHPLGSYKQGTTPFTVFCVDSDELSKLFPSS